MPKISAKTLLRDYQNQHRYSRFSAYCAHRLKGLRLRVVGDFTDESREEGTLQIVEVSDRFRFQSSHDYYEERVNGKVVPPVL